ncbi:MAG: hypothetical protein ACKVPX_07900 [Myxococcaceae bacterium]
MSGPMGGVLNLLLASSLVAGLWGASPWDSARPGEWVEYRVTWERSVGGPIGAPTRLRLEVSRVSPDEVDVLVVARPDILEGEVHPVLAQGVRVAMPRKSLEPSPTAAEEAGTLRTLASAPLEPAVLSLGGGLSAVRRTRGARVQIASFSGAGWKPVPTSAPQAVAAFEPGSWFEWTEEKAQQQTQWRRQFSAGGGWVRTVQSQLPNAQSRAETRPETRTDEPLLEYALSLLELGARLGDVSLRLPMRQRPLQYGAAALRVRQGVLAPTWFEQLARLAEKRVAGPKPILTVPADFADAALEGLPAEARLRPLEEEHAPGERIRLTAWSGGTQ